MLLSLTRFYHGRYTGYVALKSLCPECDETHTELHPANEELPEFYECPHCGFSEIFFELIPEETEEKNS